MTHHSAAPAVPHSADALKQMREDFAQFRRSTGTPEWALEQDEQGEYVFPVVQADWSIWQEAIAAWNRRPTPASDLCADLNAERINTTPASPSLDNEAAARLRKQAEEAKKVRGVVALSPEDAFALLDRLERAEAELASVPQFSRAALLEFNEKYCLNKSDLVACAESAFYWFGKCYGLKGAAAGAVPEVMTYEIGHHERYVTGWNACRAALLAAAPPAQGLPAAPEDVLDAKRHRYTRATTTAIRDPETGERIEITPEMYDAAIDRAMARDPDAKLGIKAKDIPAAASSAPTINPMCERKTDHIMKRDGYVKTGYVLRKPGADREVCVSDGGAVSWFTIEQWNWLMFNRDHVEFAWPKPHGAAPSEPVAELEELRAENDKLRDALADKVCAATMLTDISLRDGGLNMAYQGGAAQFLAEQFGQQFEDSGATNYLEIGFTSKKGLRLLVTLQRCDGKTPSQLQREAEAKLAEVLATPPAQDAGTGELLDLIAKHWRGDCWKGVTKSEAAEVNEVLANSGRTE